MTLMSKIERFGFQMREWGKWEEASQQAQNVTDRKTYHDMGESYRIEANRLKKDIKADLDKLTETEKWEKSVKANYEDRNAKAYKVYAQFNSGKMTANEAMDEIIAILAFDPNV
jgi:hypothetical protein